MCPLFSTISCPAAGSESNTATVTFNKIWFDFIKAVLQVQTHFYCAHIPTHMHAHTITYNWYTSTHTHMHMTVRPEQVCPTDEVGRFHLDLATLSVAMGRWETVPTSVTMATGGSAYIACLLFWSDRLLSASGTADYQCLPATGPGTELCDNSRWNKQCAWSIVCGKMLNTTFITVPVSIGTWTRTCWLGNHSLPHCLGGGPSVRHSPHGGWHIS